MDQTPQQTPASEPAATAQPEAPLEVFAQNLLIEKGAADLDAELVEGMKADIMQRLELLSTQVVLNALNDQDTLAFEKMVDEGATASQLQEFSNAKIPDLQRRLTEALLRFRVTYLGTTT